MADADEITLASEAVLARDWLSPEEDAAWAYLDVETHGNASPHKETDD